MTSPLPVAWTEGMFLRPQHFQAGDRYWAHEVTASVQWHHQFHYGFSSLSFSRDAITNSQFELTSCEVRLRDGTAMTVGSEISRLDLKEAFQKQTSVRVCLAVPRMSPGAANLGGENVGNLVRHAALSLDEPDENEGSNEQNITYRRLNVRLALETDNLNGFEVIPLARIRRAGEREGAPELDLDYAPPMLSVDCWPELQRDLIRGVHDYIGRKIDLVSQQVQSRGITLAAREPGDLQRIFMLHILNEADASLGAMAYAPRMHPFAVYVELCRIVGKLSIFASNRRTPELPRYDHDDVVPIFRTLRQYIEAMTQSVEEYEYEQRIFVGSGRGLVVSLEQKWLERGWEWFVGVRSNNSPEIVRKLITKLDWKIGSPERVEQLFQMRARGLEQLSDLKQVPRALPPDRQWLYYEIGRTGPEWTKASEKRMLGIRFQEHLIMNLRDLEGQQDVVVKSDAGPITLTFCLFAVPDRGNAGDTHGGLVTTTTLRSP